MNRIKAKIQEVFSSIQGEGIFVGAKQVFVRFRECNLQCAYCDEARGAPADILTPLELLGRVKLLDESNGPHHSVTLTGGEPLLYTEFLKVFLKILKKKKLKSYLETNGTLPYELMQIIDLVDIVAMDFKLPSSTLLKPFWKEHVEFLKVASKKKVFVKVLVTQNTEYSDIKKMVEIVKKIGGDIPLVLQPATALSLRAPMLDKERLLKFLEIGLKKGLDNIRIIPQVHKVLGLR